MSIFACHSFCSVPCSIQFHCFMLKMMMILSMNISDKHELQNKSFMFNPCFCSKSKMQENLTFPIFFQQKISCLFIYLFNKCLVSDCHSFMPGNTAIRMMYIVFAFIQPTSQLEEHIKHKLMDKQIQRMLSVVNKIKPMMQPSD